jgi:hypothetical protein
MGLSAHARARRSFDNRERGVLSGCRYPVDETSPLFEEIQQLLDAPPSGDGAPRLDDLEHTLTSGYARALALEAERWRLERKIGEVASKLADGTELNGEELAGLALRLTEAESELTSLRRMLGSLKTRLGAARA